MANLYLNEVDGFYSKVLGCQVTLGVIGMSLIAKKIVHLLPVNYPSLTLPGGVENRSSSLSSLGFQRE